MTEHQFIAHGIDLDDVPDEDEAARRQQDHNDQAHALGHALLQGGREGKKGGRERPLEDFSIKAVTVMILPI